MSMLRMFDERVESLKRDLRQQNMIRIHGQSSKGLLEITQNVEFIFKVGRTLNDLYSDCTLGLFRLCVDIRPSLSVLLIQSLPCPSLLSDFLLLNRPDWLYTEYEQYSTHRDCEELSANGSKPVPELFKESPWFRDTVPNVRNTLVPPFL